MTTLVAPPKPPVPVPSRIETVREPEFPTTRSCLPSPLKSATATWTGNCPTGKSVRVPKLPVPVPSRIATLPKW